MPNLLQYLTSCTLVLLLMPLHLSFSQEVFDECSSNSDNNATVVVTTDASVDIGTGYSLAEGDEIGAFTEDGICAGAGVWEDENLSFSIAGEDQDHGIDGYAPGETLQFSVFHQAADEVIDAEILYETCSENQALCNDDGTYERNAIYELSANVIPVELTSFRVTQNGSTAILEWSTASETNNAGFEVQHQTANSGKWVTEDFVDGYGTTAQPRQYSYQIEGLNPGHHRFRLHQIDFDGTSELHPIRDLYIELDQAYSITDVRPNPVSDHGSFGVRVSEPEQVSVEIFNQLGQRVDVLHDGLLTAGEKHEFDITASNYASGVYLIRISANAFSEVLNLVIVQ